MNEAPEEVIELAAMLAHTCWQYVLHAHALDPGPAWAELPGPDREEHLVFARRVCAGENPAAQHARWIASMQADGWRWAPVFDATARTHPGLVEWERLGALQRLRDQVRADHVLAWVDEWRQLAVELGR